MSAPDDDIDLALEALEEPGAPLDWDDISTVRIVRCAALPGKDDFSYDVPTVVPCG